MNVSFFSGGCLKSINFYFQLTKIIELKNDISIEECEKILKIFNLNVNSKKEAVALIKSIYKMFVSVDASMIEINPLEDPSPRPASTLTAHP